MVNPNKHANNLNEEDLEYIFNRLNKSYEEAEDSRTKKQINQQILVFILTCVRFSPHDLIRVPYVYFNGIKKDDLLYEPLKRHINNNYCQTDGLLLTDNAGNAYNVEDINSLLLSIDTGKLEKEVSVETLNKTKSRFNEYGKKSINKQEVKELLNKIEIADKKEQYADKITVNTKRNLNQNPDETKVESDDDKKGIEDIEKLSDILYQKVFDKIQYDENHQISQIVKQLDEIKEKQDILEDSLSNKHNQLSNTVNKIHKNIKASNKNYSQLDGKFKQLPVIEDKINSIITNQNDSIDEINNKLEDILQSFEENITYINDTDKDTTEEVHTTIVSTDTPNNSHINYLEEDSSELSFNEYKDFTFKWFTKNMKITRNPHDTLDINDISNKINKYVDSNQILINKEVLSDRLESYLKYWYNSYNKDIKFKDIKIESISGKLLYSYLKFIDIKHERENRIKNSIISWLKEHTVEIEGAQTYTQDIFSKLQPIFEENGWIITDSKEWKVLHDAGYTKICPNRTFSQIIGKSVQEVYDSINKDTIQRDSPTDTGFVTWYPNIQIIDKELSDNVHLIMKNELSDEIFESDNLIINWLKDNIIFTGNDNDSVSYKTLLVKLRKYLQIQEIDISENNLETIFENILISFLEHYSVECEHPIDEIGQITLKVDLSDKVSSILSKWLKNHLIKTDNIEDRVYIEDIHEKFSSLLFSEGLTIVSDDVYLQVPANIKSNFINKSHYDELVDSLLDRLVPADKVEDSLGTYYDSLKIIKYTPLTNEVLENWIKDNVSIIDQRLIMDQENLLERFEVYMADNNIRNCSDVSTLELLDVNIKQYYMNNSCGAIQVLQDDNCKKFYVGIALV